MRLKLSPVGRLLEQVARSCTAGQRPAATTSPPPGSGGTAVATATLPPTSRGTGSYLLIKKDSGTAELVVYDAQLQVRISDNPIGIRCQLRDAAGQEVLGTEYLVLKPEFRPS